MTNAHDLIRIGDRYYPTGGRFDDGAFKLKSAARFLDVDRSTIYRMMRGGELPYSMGPGGRKIPKRALVILLEQGLKARRA